MSCYDITWEQHVHNLALGSSCTQLLDLPELSLETVVDPGEDLMSEEENGQMVFIVSTFHSVPLTRSAIKLKETSV